MSSKIRLYGSTSGFVELEAPAVGDDQALVLPTASSGGFGGLVAVKHVLKTNAFTQSSVSGGANVAVDDLEITHEVADAANRLIITAFFGNAATSLGLGKAGIAIAENGTLIAIGDAVGSRARVTAGGLTSTSGSFQDQVVAMPSVTFVHTPGAGSKTYTVRVVNLASGTQTVYVNRSQVDENSLNGQRAVSSLVIQEVRV